MGVVYVVILIRGRERRSDWEESQAKGQFDSMCAAADVFFFFYSFQLKKKSHCAGRSGHILVKWCTHLLTRLWKQWGSVRRWCGWSFYLALCVCLDLLQSASSLLTCSFDTSSMRLLSATFPKVCLWTFLDHCSSPWTWHINTSCIKSSSSSKFLSASSFLLLVSVCIQLYLVNGGLWLVEPWKASTASHSHFSVSKYLLASIITPVTPFPSVFYCQWWQLCSFFCRE